MLNKSDMLNRNNMQKQYAKTKPKAKKKAIKTLRKKRTEPDLKITKVVRPPSCEVEITRVIPKITPKKNRFKNCKSCKTSQSRS